MLRFDVWEDQYLDDWYEKEEYEYLRLSIVEWAEFQFWRRPLWNLWGWTQQETTEQTMIFSLI